MMSSISAVEDVDQVALLQRDVARRVEHRAPAAGEQHDGRQQNRMRWTDDKGTGGKGRMVAHASQSVS